MQPTNPFKGQQLARTPVHISSDTNPVVPSRELDLNESHGDLDSQLDHMQSSDSMRAAIASLTISSPVQSQARPVVDRNLDTPVTTIATLSHPYRIITAERVCSGGRLLK
eukprot:SAG11_NODE_13642_length_645_cov_1.758242_2_plen_109_part_01